MTDLTPTPRPRRPRPAVVTLTPAAADRVRDLLAAQPDKAGLKIGLKNGGCAGQEYTFALAEAAEPMDEVVSADDAVGRVSAELICPYPPGVPVLSPGERITQGAMTALLDARDSGTRIAFVSDRSLATFKVLKD
jgi:arginine/lysine/ornithine decarboxylase